MLFVHDGVTGDESVLAREQVVVERLPEGERARRTVVVTVARELGVALADGRALVEAVPVRLPLRFDPDRAARVVAALEDAGATVRRVEPATAAPTPCRSHERLEGDEPCERCGALTCALCRARSASRRCIGCARRAERSRSFFRVRVAVLSTILLGVLAFAWTDVHRRRARTDWHRTLGVALVVLRRGPVADANIAALERRVPVLTDLLAAEARRFRPAAPQPFAFSIYGPVDVGEGPPAPASEGLVDLATQAWTSWRYLSRVDRAVGLDSSGLDARIYLVATPARDAQQTFVEGYSEQGGRVGFVAVELEDSMIDAALFVATHELFHTLGATDKYEPGGAIQIPEGLAEPERLPMLPQRYVELMARQRPIAPGIAEPLDSLDEMRVGAATAREVGWLR